MKKALSVFLALLLAVSAASSAVPGVSVTAETVAEEVRFIINDGQIKAPEGITVSELLAGMPEGEFCTVYQGDTLLSNDTPVGTGMTVRKTDGGTVQDLCTIVVVGDADGDAAIDAKDALRALQHTVNLMKLQDDYFAAADVDADEQVNANDALRILQYVVKLVGSFEIFIKPVELTIQAMVDDHSLITAIAAFHQKYPHVKIDLQRADNGRFTSLDHLKLQLSKSPNPPDVVIMDSVEAMEAGYGGYLLDLQQFGSADVKDQFVSSCWEAVRSQLEGQDAQFAMPLDAQTSLMLYNKDLLSRAGITQIPETWTQFTTALNQLRDLPEVITPFNLYVNHTDSLGDPSYAALPWLTYLWRLGGEVLTSDLRSVAFAGDEGIEALQMYVDLVDQYGVSGSSYDEGRFTNGRAGFDILESLRYKTLLGNPDSTNSYGAAMLPELKAGVPRFSGMRLYAMAAPNKLYSVRGNATMYENAVKTARWAYKFIEFYSTGLDYQLEYGKENYLMPSLKAAEGQGVFQGDYWATAYRQLETSKSCPGVKNWGKIKAEIAEAINEAVNHSCTPEEALKAAATKSNRHLS